MDYYCELYRMIMEERKTLLPAEEYQPPVIEAVEVCVEKGFAISDGGIDDWGNGSNWW